LASTDHHHVTAWALTTGEAGMRTQARGLARAVADVVVEKVCPVLDPWRWTSSGRLMRWGLAPGADAIAPPWPDLIVSCGRRSAVLAREARRLAAGRPLLVHVQDPRRAATDFDLIVAMRHDAVSGANVVQASTALHDLTPERLAAAGAAWAERLARLPRPLVGVILGGPAGSNAPFGEAQGRELLAGLLSLRAATGAGLAVVPSRRTPPPVVALFAEAAQRDAGIWAWRGEGDNPYLGVLALADRLVVTGDSVSMVSEALATPRPVEVFASQLRRSHAGFLEGLEAQGLVRRFDGRWIEAAPRAPVDATTRAAAAVRRLLAERQGAKLD
jgi:mitochondrial fission protein ELM1